MLKKKSNSIQKQKKIDSLSAMAGELKLNESYKSLLMGIGVVFVAAILVIGYVKNRNNVQNIQTPLEAASVKENKKTENLGIHTIVAGDDLKTISIQYYETPDLFLTIAKANALQNPDTIDEGKQLMIPKVEKTQLTPSLLPTADTKTIKGTSYSVAEGDLLWNIAVRAYGDGYKWKDILTANNLPSPDTIFAGMILQLPR